MKKIIALILLTLSGVANASTTDCKGVYIGRIWVQKGVGLQRVVYLNHPDNASGSYWSNFTGWTAEERQEALALLMAAKASRHKVDVVTGNSDGCGLQAGFTETQAVVLATNP